MILGLLAAALHGSPSNASPLVTADVSPETPHLTPGDAYGNQGAGRILQVALPRTALSLMYAASEWAGVWKSNDYGQSWTQSSSGLRNGITEFSYNHVQFPVLAVDDVNGSRLLYATQTVDGRRGVLCPDGVHQDCNLGGLYTSLNAAISWNHVDLDFVDRAHCHRARIQGVGFALGDAFVLTQSTGCQLLVSSDPGLAPASFSILPAPPFPPGADTSMALSSGGDPATGGQGVLFACQGNTAYRKVDPASASPAWEMVPLAVGTWCYAITPVPAAAGVTPTQALVVVMSSSTGAPVADVQTVDFPSATATTFPVVLSNQEGSGAYGIWAPRRPTVNAGATGPANEYDVYAADALHMYRWTGSDWHQLQGLHADPFSMAFPYTYDPLAGVCDAFVGDDGGVFFDDHSGGPLALLDCLTNASENGWLGASSGLHVLFSTGLTGLSRPIDISCIFAHILDPGRPCPVLYVGSADTDTWTSATGGVPQAGWADLYDGLGDSAGVFLDPTLPALGLAVRNGNYHLFYDSTDYPAPGDAWAQIAPPDAAIKIQAPNPTGVAQVQSLASEPASAAPYGDYLAVASPFELDSGMCRENGTCGDDVILRNTVAGNPVLVGNASNLWDDLSPQAHFGPGQIGGIYPSGGHAGLVVYVLTSNGPGVVYPPKGAGQIWRGQVDGNGLVTAWTSAFGLFPGASIVRAYNVFVNPYDPAELYAVDLGDRTIKESRNGGTAWSAIPILKDVATHYGEFDFDCGNFAYGTQYYDKQILGNQCPLAQMVFVRDHPEIRVAVLYPGGVAFSRNAGKSWIPLDATNAQPALQPIELPHSAFYDPEPIGGTNRNSLFVALEGKGVKRIDAPFPTLVGLRLAYRPPPSVPGGPPPPGAVDAVVRPLDEVVPLHLEDDGVWYGDTPFDGSVVTSLEVDILADGVSALSLQHDLDASELADGSVTLGNVPEPGAAGEGAVGLAALAWLARRRRPKPPLRAGPASRPRHRPDRRGECTLPALRPHPIDRFAVDQHTFDAGGPDTQLLRSVASSSSRARRPIASDRIWQETWLATSAPSCAPAARGRRCSPACSPPVRSVAPLVRRSRMHRRSLGVRPEPVGRAWERPADPIHSRIRLPAAPSASG